MPQMMYFGKIPARGDFVKANVPAQVAALLDNWISQGMELLVADPDWKEKYDGTAAIDFLFTRTRGKGAIAGTLMPSRDHTERRYPFLVFSAWESVVGGTFLHRAPLIFNRHWHRTASWTTDACNGSDPVKALLEVEEEQVLAEPGIDGYDSVYNDFLEMTDLRRLAALLDGNSTAGVRQAILGLSLLLQPLRMNTGGAMYRGFSLPLPRDPLYGALVATFWQDLLGVFLAAGDYDVAVYMCQRKARSNCVFNLAGPTARTFQALFDGVDKDDAVIDLSRATWVDEQTQWEYALRKLDSFLAYPELSLQRLVQTFREAYSAR